MKNCVNLCMENLTIGFDAKRAVCNNTGLGNYSRLVLDVLSDALPDANLRLYSPVKKENDRLDPLLKKDNVRLVTPSGVSGKLLPSLWRVGGGITRQLKADGVGLFHGLSNELPLGISRSRIPSIVTIHDLIFLRLPYCYRKVDRMIYDYKFRKACENATRIIAISKCTRKDLVYLYDVDPEKIDVVYQGCDPRFSQPVDDAVKEDVRRIYGLPENYIVAVGTVEQRKNQMQAIKALAGLPKDVSLVIVGGHNRSYYRPLVAEISRLRLGERVKFLSGVPFRHLPAIYAGACFSSYTSKYEGFGIPVIEALSCGVPVLAAKYSCLEEAGGDGALYIDPYCVDDYVDAAKLLLSDSDLRERLVKAGKSHISQFTPQNFASGLLASYRHALDSH